MLKVIFNWSLFEEMFNGVYIVYPISKVDRVNVNAVKYFQAKLLRVLFYENILLKKLTIKLRKCTM